MEEKNKKNIELKLPSGFNWFWTFANRDFRKGRPWGGLLIGVRSNIKSKDHWSNQKECVCGATVTMEGEEYVIIAVYCRTGVNSIKDLVADKLDTNKQKKCLLVGDWNARIGTCGGKRTSKDTVCNIEGKELLELLDDFNLHVLNGNTEGDWQGEFTHTDYQSQSVIDYAAVKEDTIDLIKTFTIGDRIKSDHFPLEITVNVNVPAEKVQPIVKWSQKYTPESIAQYTQSMNAEPISEEASWEVIRAKIKKHIPRVRTVIRSEPRNSWWNEECFKARRTTVEALRAARIASSQERWTIYFEERKRYKAIIRHSKMQRQAKVLQELREVKDIRDAWQYIRRAKQQKAADSPTEDQLANHFMELLDGRPYNRITNVVTTDTIAITQNVSEEEFEHHLGRLKKRKACGPDDIMAEALIYADTSTKSAMRSVIEGCLNGKALAHSWREATIHSLHKKGPTNVAANYRGISIGNAIYKLYASILTTRLSTFVDENDLLPDTQNGFRAKRSAIDNIYVLNFCSQLKKQLYCAFIDFRAAFDRVNRAKLFAKMKKLGIPEYLIKAIAEIYNSTPYTIGTTTFVTEMGLKQGCPLSPLLFALYISDIDKTFRLQQCGGTVIGKVKIYLLSYADDIVLIAESAAELKEMLRVLKRYTERKDMSVNTAKSKVLRFNKSGRLTGQTWKCGNEELEEVRSFNYLGFTFQCSGSHSEHIKALASKGKRRVSEVWSIGERKFENNYTVRHQMYKSLVEPIIVYGCEIFGFSPQEDLDKVQRKYYRWVLGLNQHTKTAYLMDETKIATVYNITGRRAIDYERRSLTSPCAILRECIRLVHLGQNNQFVKSRANYCQRGGKSSVSVTSSMLRGENIANDLQLRNGDVDVQLRGNTLRETRFARIRTDGIPLYLRRGKDIKLLARFRLENEERGRQKWRADKKCRICGNACETVEHILADCMKTSGGAIIAMDHSGKGADTLRNIIKRRTTAKS